MTFPASCTWSHNIDDDTQLPDTGLANVVNKYARGAERSSANIEMRHSLTTSFTWELPFGKGRLLGSNWGTAADAIVGGWQVGGIVSRRTGLPFEVTFPGDPKNTQATNRGNRVGDGKLSNPSIDGWFDQSAFVISEPGVLGNNGRNVVVGPGGNYFDFMPGKRFRMPNEGRILRFRFEAFNFTNTPRFGQPVCAMLRAATGTINRAGEPRRIQFGLKYVS